MKTYNVHFSVYSEEYGEFQESFYRVDAENQFEARRAAWLLRDDDEDSKFQSCVKQCGVSLDASPLDLRDYFNAQAAYCKYRVKLIENVDMTNAKIRQDIDSAKRADDEYAYYLGCLEAVFFIARDIGKPFGMEPPNAYEEIEYAWQLTGKLDEMGHHDKAEALARVIDKAKKWDTGSIYTLRSLFLHDSIHLPGDYLNFAQFFGRDGVFPERADVNEREYQYIHRWTNARHIDKLSHLPKFGEKDVIQGSAGAMPFEYKTLALRQERLTPAYQKPENLLWTPLLDGDGNCPGLNDSPACRFDAQNMITGAVVTLRRRDFFGVLRPEHSDNIDFDALKQEYAAQHAETDENEYDGADGFDGDEDDEDWEDEV